MDLFLVGFIAENNITGNNYAIFLPLSRKILIIIEVNRNCISEKSLKAEKT